MSVRPGVAAVAVAGLLALAGCGEKATTASQADDPNRVESAAQPPAAAPSQAAPSASQPAAAAGGACGLLDYDKVAGALGERFQIAVAGGAEPVKTCVLKQVHSRYPDLTLAVAPTKADAKVFTGTVAPKDSRAVSSLGKAAYSRNVPSDGVGGTGAEVGWLSANGRLLTIRYILPAGGDAAAAGEATPKLVALAKQIEAAGIAPNSIGFIEDYLLSLLGRVSWVHHGLKERIFGALVAEVSPWAKR